MVRIILSTLIFVVAPFLLNAQTPSNIVGVPIKLETIEITQYEFPKKMSYAEAKVAIARLGNGWRLPNWDELNEILIYNQKTREFTDIHNVLGEHGSQEESQKDPLGVTVDFDYYNPDGPIGYWAENTMFFVRPVRTLKK
jgi:hypothetical protein